MENQIAIRDDNGKKNIQNLLKMKNTKIEINKCIKVANGKNKGYCFYTIINYKKSTNIE